MERSEPSLVPEWLRSNGSGSPIHPFASSQADGPALTSPINRSSKSINNSDSSHSPLVDRSSSFNSWRNTVTNGFNKHDKSSYAQSYSSFSRSRRDRDRERSTSTNRWDLGHADPLRGIMNGRADDPLRRSQSLISSRNSEAPKQKVSTDISNGIHKNSDKGIGINKVSFERDFPVLGSEDRPKTPDVISVSSPGLSRGVIGYPLLVGNEAWTSALADIPSGAGSNDVVSSPTLNMAKALTQAPVQPHNAPQLQKDELALAQSKKLIPVTSVPKTTVLSSSDKLKIRTTMRLNETALTPKNGVHHPSSPLVVSSQPIRVESVKGDDPKSPSTGKLLLLKPGRENGVSLKNSHIPTTNLNIGVANSPSKNPKILSGPNNGALVDKRTSRNNFFKLVREKSSNNTSGAVGSEVSSPVENDAKVNPAEARNEVACDSETCTLADNLSPSAEVDNEEERAFLLSLGWDDKAGDGEEGITEEEIKAFCIKVIEQGVTSRVCDLLQTKLFAHGFSSSCESNTSISQTEA